MRRDLESNANMGALAVEQLLLSAEASGSCAATAPPTLDMAIVEDEAALARMQRLTEEFRAGVAAAGSRGAGVPLKMVRDTARRGAVG